MINLGETERNSDTILKLIEHLHDKIKECHVALEKTQSEIDTAVLRGQLKAYRLLIKDLTTTTKAVT
jgi:hypothetical protein